MLKNIFAENCRINLHKHPGPPFQIRPGPGYFSIAPFTQNQSSAMQGLGAILKFGWVTVYL